MKLTHARRKMHIKDLKWCDKNEAYAYETHIFTYVKETYEHIMQNAHFSQKKIFLIDFYFFCRKHLHIKHDLTKSQHRAWRHSMRNSFCASIVRFWKSKFYQTPMKKCRSFQILSIFVFMIRDLYVYHFHFYFYNDIVCFHMIATWTLILSMIKFGIILARQI